MATLQFIILVIFPFLCFSTKVDKTLDVDETGLDVVDAVILKIRRLGIFPDDSNYLRRLSYVETRFGYTQTPDGGLWNIAANVFTSTMNVPDDISTRIETEFGIKWSDLVHVDCRKPLISGLAVSIVVVLNLKDDTGITQPIQNLFEQAQFLESIKLTPSGNIYFGQIYELERHLVCHSPIDLTIVLGGSVMNSEHSSFEFTTRDEVAFTKEMVRYFNTTTSRFGLVTLNAANEVVVPLKLDDDVTNEDISEIITNTDYATADSATTFINSQIAAAVQMIKTAAATSTGHPGIPKVLIILSNRETSGSDGVTNIDLAVEAGIKTYALSIGHPLKGSVHDQQILLLAQNMIRNVFLTYHTEVDGGFYQAGLFFLPFRLIPQLCALHHTLEVDSSLWWVDELAPTEVRFFAVPVVLPLPPDVENYFINIEIDGVGVADDLVASISDSELYPNEAMYDLRSGVGETLIPVGSATVGSVIYIRVINNGDSSIRFNLFVTTTKYVATTTTTETTTTTTTTDSTTTSTDSTTTTTDSTTTSTDSTTTTTDSTTISTDSTTPSTPSTASTTTRTTPTTSTSTETWNSTETTENIEITTGGGSLKWVSLGALILMAIHGFL